MAKSKAVWPKKDVETLAQESRRIASEALDLAIHTASIVGYTPDQRDICFRLYRQITLGLTLRMLEENVAYAHLTGSPRELKARLEMAQSQINRALFSVQRQIDQLAGTTNA